MNDCANPVKIPFTCHCCQRNGVATYDATCAPIRLERWVPLLVCNRCGDFHAGRRLMADGLWKTCYSLAVIMDTVPDASVRSEAIRQARERLNVKTKMFAAHVCNFWRVMTMWEPDFTQILLEKPRQCEQVLKDYERRISNLCQSR
jgi:hypothetical protein